MRALPALYRRLRASREGAGTVEFALVAPILVIFIIGGMYLSMLGFTAASLSYAVQSAARCASINSTRCSSAATTQTFAATQFVNFSGNAATFTASAQTCGNQVTGTVNFRLLTGSSRLTVPLSSTACFPLN